MNSTRPKSNAARHHTLAFLVGLIAVGVAYADDLPEVITGLSVKLAEPLRITLISSSKARITGRVQEARWTGHNLRRTTVLQSVPVYASGHEKDLNKDKYIAYYKDVLKEKVEPLPTTSGSYKPSKIMLWIGYRSSNPAFEADVLTDGQFSGYVELEAGSYFSNDPNINVKPGYTWWRTENKVVFAFDYPKTPGVITTPGNDYQQLISLYFIGVNESLAEGLLTKVRIEFAEKNSRAPVKPDIRVTIDEGPTFDSIIAEWKGKYDDAVLKKLEEKLRATMGQLGAGVIQRGDVKQIRNEDTVEFWAYVGSSFRVESRDRNFYYFQGVFKADKAPLTKKTVLLVETGGKIRPDDEGRGGQIISD
jgi:hypothetical protein